MGFFIYERLKQDKLYSIHKTVKQRNTTNIIKEKFGSIRTKIHPETQSDTKETGKN